MRLLHKGQWFDPLPPGSTREKHFEALLIDRAADLFPDFIVRSWAREVQDRRGNLWHPDILMVERNLKSWHIVEVERSDHSLHDHVLPQVEGFVTADIGGRFVEKVAPTFPEFSERQLQDLVTLVPHETTVIVDQPCADWSEPIRRQGGRLAVVQRFRDRNGVVLLLVDGLMPEGSGQIVSELRVPREIYRGKFLVATPAPLRGRASVPVTTEYGLEHWRIREYGNDVFLDPPSPRDLDKPATLYEVDLDEYVIRQHRRVV